MLTAYQYDQYTGQMGHSLGQVGFDGQLGTDWGALINAGASLATQFIPGAKDAAKTACGIINNPMAGGIATGLLTKAVGSDTGNSITKAAGYASQACGSMFPKKTTTQTQKTTGTTPTKKPAAKKYPAGSITWKNKMGVWVIAIPKGTMLSGSGLGALVHGFGLGDGQLGALVHGFGLGSSDVGFIYPQIGDPGLGETHTVVGTSATQPTGVQVVTEKAGKSATTPIYKKWWFWAAIGGGVVTLGTGGYFLFRRKK